jgi:hypothetical protein
VKKDRRNRAGSPDRREADHAPGGVQQVQKRIARKRKSQAVWSEATEKRARPTTRRARCNKRTRKFVKALPSSGLERSATQSK